MSGAARVHLSPPDVGELEERYVLAALRSGWVAPVGPDLDAFESEVARRAGVANAVATSSGTAALHLALLSWRIGAGEVVIVPTLTFAATANAVAYTGATPYFVDCDPHTGNLDPGLLDEAITTLRAAGRSVRAAVPVDLLGKCADYGQIEKVAEQHRLPLLCDAAESLGAAHNGRPAGSFGQASALSFNGNKVLTTSGGGMLLTDDAGLARRARYLATQAREPVAHYEHAELGYNYRLSNILAALGRAQLCRLAEMIGRRRLIRDSYREAFAGLPGVRILGGDDDAEDNCWLSAVVVDPAVAGWSAADLGAALTALDIESRPLWKPMHLQPLYARAERLVTGAAQRLFETGLVLPSGSALSGADLSRVLTCVRSFVAERRP
jgi:dTDP-4-amino-4,6-dideoxygalactose transaminase